MQVLVAWERVVQGVGKPYWSILAKVVPQLGISNAEQTGCRNTRQGYNMSMVDLCRIGVGKVDKQKGQRSRYKQTKVEKDKESKGDVIV
jgi:hypothetical protein